MKLWALIIVLIVILAGLIYLGFFNDQHPKQSQSSHIYLGAIYNGPFKKTNSISGNLYFNGGKNIKEIQYYVVLSVWDSNNSYDQIGISSVDGLFFSTYSYTEIINGSIKYEYDATWFPIGEGLHIFGMTIRDGYVDFKFDNISIEKFTGGNYFLISKSIIFNQKEYTGFTLYEEIYKFSGNLPAISFNFTNVMESSDQEITGLIPLSQNISTDFSTIMINGNTVNIYNQNALTLKVRIDSPTGEGFIDVADINKSIRNNLTYSIPLIPGQYIVKIQFKTSISTYNYSKSINLYKNIWINETIAS